MKREYNFLFEFGCVHKNNSQEKVVYVCVCVCGTRERESASVRDSF